MVRSTARLISGAWLLLALAWLLASQSGCTAALTTLVYLVQGNNAPAEYGGLKNKKVAVVCRPQVELKYSSANAATELAAEVGRMLTINKDAKVRVIDARKVAEWTDENTWDNFTEIGEALEADMVLGIELEHFELLQSQTVYQGKANFTVKIYDMQQGGKLVYEKRMPQTLYPPNIGISTSDKSSEDAFRREFITAAADEIGRYFYPHDRATDFARDNIAID